MTFDPRVEGRTKWIMGVGAAALAVSCVTAAMVILTVPSKPAGMVQARAPAPVVAAADTALVPQVIIPQPAAATPAVLARDDIREIQARLLSFGFNPGPLDGEVGRTTVVAAMNYQQQRGQAQTGQLDRAMLDQLRQDPAPKVAQSRAGHPSQRVADSSSPPPQRRRSDGLEFVRNADARLSRWFQSLSH